MRTHESFQCTAKAAKAPTCHCYMLFIVWLEQLLVAPPLQHQVPQLIPLLAHTYEADKTCAIKEQGSTQSVSSNQCSRTRSNEQRSTKINGSVEVCRMEGSQPQEKHTRAVCSKMGSAALLWAAAPDLKNATLKLLHVQSQCMFAKVISLNSRLARRRQCHQQAIL